MKKKTNNHYISEFQLKYFRCSDPPRWAGKYSVWVYRAQSDANLCNVRGVASALNFYGKRDDALEDAFANLESLSGQAFSEIARDPTLVEKHSQALCDFVWVLSFRTKALRERVRDGIGTAVERMGQSTHSPEAIMHFRRSFGERLDHEIAKKIEKLNVFERIAFKSSDEYVGKMNEAGAVFEQLIRSGDFSRTMSEGFEDFGGLLAKSSALADSHNEILGKQLFAGSRCPEKLRPSKWTTVQTPEDYFVLGDGGIFSINAEREVSSMLGGVSDWTEIYLPISPRIAVCGLRHDGRPQLAVEEVRRYAIESSFEEFFASYYSEELISRSELIDKNGPILSAGQIDEIVKSVWREK